MTAELAALIKKQTRSERVEIFSSLEDCLRETSSIDVVLLMDIIEHSQDEDVFLSGLLNDLRPMPGVTVFVTVPAHQFLFGEHDKSLGHWRRYSRQSLCSLLAGQGLVVRESGSLFSSLFLVRTVQKLLSIRVSSIDEKGTIGVAGWRRGKCLTDFVTAMLMLDFGICRLLLRTGLRLPGLSCYAICQTQ